MEDVDVIPRILSVRVKGSERHGQMILKRFIGQITKRILVYDDMRVYFYEHTLDIYYLLYLYFYLLHNVGPGTRCNTTSLRSALVSIDF
jgi:hypothetical protein